VSVVFFSYSETGRETVLIIKGRAVNPMHGALQFRVQDLLWRWSTVAQHMIRQALSKSLSGTSRTMVFVGQTHLSYWVPEELSMTLAVGKPSHAIALPAYATVPHFLPARGITVYARSDRTFQLLATR
jgi:hypothetical protein